MKVAIVYDRVNKWGGAERVLLALHEIFPKAPLYTSVYDEKGAPWAKVFPKVYTSFLQKLAILRSNHEFLAVFMPFAFSSFDFSKYDLVISVTSELAKGIRVRGKTRHICYCLTPTRYLWSGYKEYFRWKPLKIFGLPAVLFLRKWDRNAAQKPDMMVAISTEVKKRIKKYYGRDSEIIFPPVDIPKLQIPRTKLQTNPNLQKAKRYYLLVSRLDYGYKKVDLAIEAFNKLSFPLVIVGTGREEKRLRKIAKDNIFFAGRVNESKLKKFYKGARALIMPQEEDFGIVSVEAQSFGLPVIAYKKGGASDTVINGKTGILFNKQNVSTLVNEVRHYHNSNYGSGMYGDCLKNAKRFSKANFKKEFLSLTKKVLH